MHEERIQAHPVIITNQNFLFKKREEEEEK
jgi:hypothetical protein